MDDTVLSKTAATRRPIRTSVRAGPAHGLELGLQMMTGLYGATGR
ncbi:MAG: hypothetical protein ACLSDO_00160 [Anaerotruncus colihominis]